MSRSQTLKSFAELAEALNLDEPSVAQAAAEPEQFAVAAIEPAAPLDFANLLAELEAASATLATVMRQDQETRSLALRDLEQYDALVGRQHEAEAVGQRARQVRNEAETLSNDAFAEEARDQAKRVAIVAGQAEATALRSAEQWGQQAQHLARQLDLERLLAERQRQEEVDKAKAAEAETAQRLIGALAQVRETLDAGRLEEAKGLLGPLMKEHPGNPEVASLNSIVSQRELTVKVDAAEEVLWTARRSHRRDPAEAVAILATIDVQGLPEPLARQVFGEWARACARLCREREIAEPLRYAPDPGRGAIIARETPDGAYVVISALSMGPAWETGKAVDDRQVRRAHPLR